MRIFWRLLECGQYIGKFKHNLEQHQLRHLPNESSYARTLVFDTTESRLLDDILRGA